MSKTYQQFLGEGVKAEEIEDRAKEAADYLESELQKMFPDHNVRVKYNKNLGTSLYLYFFGNEEGVKVTRHNSKTSIDLIMHLGHPSKKVDLYKVAWEKNTMASDLRGAGVKFRKINAKNIMDASKKLVGWFAKNEDAIKSLKD